MCGTEVVKVLERLGWEVVRRRSSHIIMVKEGHIATLSIPDHQEVAQGTLRSLIRSAGLTVEEFIDASRRI
jgi:predicted RNA binding protein YcfA (HicA-like mRNA interferase family)